MAIDLVIFDCDDVLCRQRGNFLSDVDRNTDRSWLSDQVLDRFLGMSDREAPLNIEAEIGCRLPDDFEALMSAPLWSATRMGYDPSHGCNHCRPNHDGALRAAGAHGTFADMRQLPVLVEQIEARIAGN